MGDGNQNGRDGKSGELTEKQREWQERRDAAIKLLKKRGIWAKLLDESCLLRHVHTGYVKIHEFKLDAERGFLRDVSEVCEGMEHQELTFLLQSRNFDYEEWFYERSEEYNALETLWWDWWSSECSL